jgi:hypothetical protein
MDKTTFIQRSQPLRTAFQLAKIPMELSDSLIDIQRGPLSTLEAHVAAYDYYTALPGDPAGNLTLDDISELLQQSVDDWRISLKAVEDVTAFVMHPDRLQASIAIGQHLDWQGLRTTSGNPLNPKEKPSALALDAFSDYGQLAKAGSIADAFHKTGRQFAEVAELNAGAFETHAKQGRGKQGYDRGRHFEVTGYGARATGWGMAGVVTSVGAYGFYTSQSYGAVTALGYLAAGGGAVCGGVAIASFGLAVYGLHKAYQRMRWDDGNG